MKKLSAHIALLVLLLLAGCEKDFYIAEQQTGKRMVVNCVFDNYRVFRVFVTESSLLSGGTKLVPLPDANVALYQDGTMREELRYIPSDTLGIFGSFQSTFVPQPGKRYSIMVTHPVYGTVTATDALLKEPDVTYAETKEYKDVTNRYTWQGRMRFTDNVAEVNYYRLFIWMDWTSISIDAQTGDTIRTTAATAPRPDIGTELQDTTRDNGWQFLFSDKGFNGQEKDLQFYFYGLDTALLEHANYHFELSAVSREHYEYFRTLELYRKANSGETEPVDVFTNVKNGYGIFAGQSIKAVAIPLK